MQSIKDYVQEREIELEVTDGPHYYNEESDWGYAHHRWEVTLTNGAWVTEMPGVPFHTGVMTTADPDAAHVLDCLVRDAWTYLQAGTFEQWCDEFDYDPDSRKHYAVWEQIKTQAAELIDFLGGERELEIAATRYEGL